VSSKFEDFQFPAVLTLENYVEYFEKTDKVLFDALRVLDSLVGSIGNISYRDGKHKPLLAPFYLFSDIERYIDRFKRTINLSNCTEIIFDLHIKHLAIAGIQSMKKTLTFEKIFGDKNGFTDADLEQLMKTCENFLSVVRTMFEILKFFINSYTDIFELKNCFETFPCGRMKIKFDI
jgi:hypothetical protein